MGRIKDAALKKASLIVGYQVARQLHLRDRDKGKSQAAGREESFCQYDLDPEYGQCGRIRSCQTFHIYLRSDKVGFDQLVHALLVVQR